MKVFRTNLAQALGGRGFLLAALGTVLALVSANFEMLLLVFRAGGGPMEAGFLLLFLQEALSSDTMALVLPIVAALPLPLPILMTFTAASLRLICRAADIGIT